jgi:hypothetical protein
VVHVAGAALNVAPALHGDFAGRRNGFHSLVFLEVVMKYRVTVTLEADPGIPPEDVADHCAVACKAWGGQYRPEDPLFSANVDRVTATCRGEVAVYPDPSDLETSLLSVVETDATN